MTARIRQLLPPSCAAILCALSVAQAADYTLADLNDADTLERSLFVCLWKAGHGAPEGEPSPVVCTTAALSTDDAVHETKQFWTYWARFNTADAVKAKIRFNDDFEAFQARQQEQPDLAQRLLPQGGALPKDDWRVLLVQQLTARAKARLKDPGKH
ncbi:MAG TPA: hypothetical protein VGG49_04610 [Steroidobacteraceae bacterium]|jgi:hypothetical protein